MAPLPEEVVDEETAEAGNEAVRNEDQVEEGEEEPEEALRPKGLRHPEEPADAARIEHELTHQPVRPWCKFCVGGRSQNNQHKLIGHPGDPGAAAIPTFSLDYLLMGNAWMPSIEHENLHLFDHTTKSIEIWQTYRTCVFEWAASNVSRFS